MAEFAKDADGIYPVEAASKAEWMRIVRLAREAQDYDEKAGASTTTGRTAPRLPPCRSHLRAHWERGAAQR